MIPEFERCVELAFIFSFVSLSKVAWDAGAWQGTKRRS